MKQYLKKLSWISLLFAMLLVLMASVKIIIFRHHSWKLPAEKHILFMGASHIQHAIDDRMVECAINWAQGSERYMYTYIKLQYLLSENPQVDTVFLGLAPTDLWKDTDYKYHTVNDQSRYVKLYWPYYKLEHWKIFMSEPAQILNLVATSLLDLQVIKQDAWWSAMGGFEENGKLMDPLEWQASQAVANGAGHSVNYNYLRRIITLCKGHNVRLFFIYCPMYHPEYFYDQEYYYNAYRNNFPDIQLYDYSHWDGIPLDGFADPHHLNPKGARIFTSEIKLRFGIE